MQSRVNKIQQAVGDDDASVSPKEEPLSIRYQRVADLMKELFSPSYPHVPNEIPTLGVALIELPVLEAQYNQVQ